MIPLLIYLSYIAKSFDELFNKYNFTNKSINSFFGDKKIKKIIKGFKFEVFFSGQFSVFIPTEAGFLPPQLDGRFSSHLAQSNHIIHPEGGLYSLPPGLNDMYPVCSGPPMGGGGQIPNESEFINATSDFPQILDMKESEIYNSMKLANQISHPIDKLYSMQNSYFTS